MKSKNFIRTNITLLLILTAILNAQVVAAHNTAAPESIIDEINYGDWTIAENQISRILNRNPNNAGALVARALLSSLEGQESKALVDLNRVLSVNPRFPQALYFHGKMLFERGILPAGKKELKQYLEKSKANVDIETDCYRAQALNWVEGETSSNVEWTKILKRTATANSDCELFARGVAQCNLNKYSDAIQTFETLKKKHRVAPRLEVYQALCYVCTGKYEIAKKAAEKIEKIAPNYTENQICLGYVLENQKNFAAAIKYYSLVLKTNDCHRFALVQRGICYSKKGDNILALKDLDKAINIDPTRTGSLAARGYAYARSGQHTKAISDLERATSINAEDSTAWCQLGNSLAKTGAWESALAAVNRALAIDPEYIDAFCVRAWVRSGMGENGKAYDDFATAIRIEPNYAYAYYSRGLLLKDEKKYKKSIEDFSKAIKINPQDPEFFCARGCSEVRNADYKEAISDCTISIRLNPNRLHPFLSRGEAYAGLGKYDLALCDLTKVITDAPTYKEALLERAKVYQKLNKEKEASVDLANAKKVK